MSATRHGIAGCLLVAAAVIATAERAPGQFRDFGREPQRPEVRGVLKAADAAAGTVTIATGRGREATPDSTYAVAKDAEVVVGSGRGRGLFHAVKLADLPAGTVVSLALSADQKTVEALVAEEPSVQGVLKSVDAAKNTLTVGQGGGREPVAEETTYALAPHAEIAVDDGRGRRLSIKEAKLTELVPGAMVTLRLSVDRKHVHSVIAEGANLYGLVKAVDPAKNTVTLAVRPPRGDDAGEERVLPVAGDALVLLDDGKGRLLSLKQGKLGDVPVGAAAAAKLSPDQSQVMSLRAEGPTVTGLLKVADPAKGTITITQPRGRGEEPEEKTFTVAGDARVLSEGAAAKLGDLKAGDNGPVVQLRLSLDQKTVQFVVSRQPQPR
jgi:hypothetical protein